MKNIIIICWLLAGCSASEQASFDFQPSRPVSHPEAQPSGELTEFVIEAFPVFTLDHEYGGTVVGPEGELMDGSKVQMVLDLKAKGKTIRVQDPPIFPRNFMSDSELETGRLYRFTLSRSGKIYEIITIHDGDKLIYPKKRD